MIQAILLDLDNTMVLYDEPLFYKRYFERVVPLFADLFPAESFADRLLTATMALRENDGGQSNREFFIDRLCDGDAALGRKAWDRFMQFYENGYDSMGVPVAVPEGLAGVLDRLVKRRIPLVLASNPIFPKTAQQKRMRWGGIDSGIFNLMTHMENMSFTKPREAYYRQIAEMMAVPTEACLMVGNDRINDMAAGNAGMKTYLTVEAGDIDYSSLALTDDSRRGEKDIPEPDFKGPFEQIPRILDALAR